MAKIQICRWYPNPGKNTDITFFKGRSILHRCLQYLQNERAQDTWFLWVISAIVTLLPFVGSKEWTIGQKACDLLSASQAFP